MVVVSYDENESEPDDYLAVEVANRVRSLFNGKQQLEVHLARKSTALHILGVLADRRVR